MCKNILYKKQTKILYKKILYENLKIMKIPKNTANILQIFYQNLKQNLLFERIVF